MAEVETITVSLLGKKYQVSCEEEEVEPEHVGVAKPDGDVRVHFIHAVIRLLVK